MRDKVPRQLLCVMYPAKKPYETEASMEGPNTWKCPTGTFVGYVDRGCQQVRGIRYASSERYGAPVPYVYGPGAHECIEPAPFAVQLRSDVETFLAGIAYESFPQEESCQYLSLATPGNACPGDALPVMVWIHGGAYRNGGCDSPSYDRVPLVSENNVILVAVNYRLSLLGFVRDQQGGFANNGLLDVIEALRWIQTNIASFGGDPSNVTIFGQSAGADCVRCIMLAEGTDGLYRRAIMQSDPLGTLDGRDDMERKILDELNELPVDASLDEIRSAQVRITANVTEKGNAKYMIFGPHFGVHPLPAKSQIAARIRQVAPSHELLCGSNAREVSAYIGSNRTLMALHGCFLTRWIVELVVKRKSAAIFTAADDAFARSYAEAGGRVWRYLFSWGLGRSPIGACHAMDCVPLFGLRGGADVPIAMGYTEEDVRRQGLPMRRIWADFAKTGVVTSSGVEDMIEIANWTR